MNWKAKTKAEIVETIIQALKENTKYSEASTHVLGFPGSYLDNKVFVKLYKLTSKSSLQSAFLHVLRENPNHIGCHTLEKSTSEFKGTHRIEKELLAICAEQILGATPNTWDGYVASGGTEANIEAMWIFRNFWLEHNEDKRKDYHTALHIVASKDAHYSLEKGANLLGVSCSRISINEKEDRQIDLQELFRLIKNKSKKGVVKFLLILNMGSTNFGSVDDIDRISKLMDEMNVEYEIHVDGAFGGFIYPFTNTDNKLNFSNPKIMSFTLDAHKMLQAPYGTGIFITKKKRIKTVKTAAATYIPGNDVTVCGSRSGANAIVTWMILQAYGSEEGRKFCKMLINTTDYLCSELSKMNIAYYRNEFMNVVAISADSLSEKVASAGTITREYHLVPDNHKKTKWWRVVIMQHAELSSVEDLISDIRKNLKFPNKLFE